MNYKEKYEMALERAKCLYSQHEVEWTDKDIEYIFPELKKSEDERLRKELINYFTEGREFLSLCSFGRDKILAWLEKQAEQKPIDKVEPKFHEGDWAVSNLYRNARQISEVHFDEYNSYYVVDGKSVNLEEYDRLHHLWTIADAKCGDVLVASDESLFIFARAKGDAAYYYFSLCKNGSQEISDGKYAWEVAKDCYPATKEQRDLLFKKIHEAGYMWDSDSKQLLSLKAEPNNEKKSAWSKEDEGNLTDTCVAIRKFYHGTNGAQELIDWLKSLKARCTWKPSDKQIRALRWVLNNIPYNTHKEEISGLLEQIQNI